jgi:GGDEF domain-containing protein
MKDPKSSAYTFAYFVDVAGREIDTARRHGRRFALATIGLPETGPLSGGSGALGAVEQMLTAVRDTDVLARVDEREFYLLLPETGGLGAHTCRRRVLNALSQARSDESDVSMGVATFPHDGQDLSQLLRMAKHRAEAAQQSIVRKHLLDRLPLRELVEALLGPDIEPVATAFQRIQLPQSEVMSLAGTAVAEARRGGRVRIVANQKPGLCVGAAVRAALSGSKEGVRFDAIELGAVPGCENLEVLCLIAEHGAYGLLGASDGSTVRAAHSADPVFADVLIQRLGEAVGTRLLD